MTFEGGFLLIFAFLFGVPVLLLLARFVGWLTGTKSKPVWLVLIAAVVLPIAFSLYLDNAGTVRKVMVKDKREEVRLSYKGSWTRTISVGVEYEKPEETIPALLSLSCDANTFDALQVGQSIDVHILDYGQIFKFARLKNRSTFSFLAELFSSTPRGPWQETTAVVKDVRHITDYSYHRHASALRWPYDVVELSFVPPGRQDPISAVDVIEAGSVPDLVEGQPVKITWPQDHPRAAKIVGAAPGAPWLNWFYHLGAALALLAAVLGFFGVLAIFKKRKKAKRQRLDSGKQEA